MRTKQSRNISEWFRLFCYNCFSFVSVVRTALDHAEFTDEPYCVENSGDGAI